MAQLSDMTGIKEGNVMGIDISDGINYQSTLSGKIVKLDASEGQEIDLGHIIGRFVDDSKFIGEIKIAPSDYASIKVGDPVVLQFESSKPHTAIVTKLNPNPVPNVPEKGSEKAFAEGFVHKGTIEGINPGLVQTDMKFTIGKRNDVGVRYYGYKGKIKGCFKEKKLINTIKAVITEVHVLDMETVKKGDPIITMASDDIQAIEESRMKLENCKMKLMI